MEFYSPRSGREAKEFAAEVKGIDLLQDCGLVLNRDGTDYIYPQQTEEGMGGIT